MKGKFEQFKNYSTEDHLELLAFVKKAYVMNDITIRQYREIVKEIQEETEEPIVRN